MPAARAWQRVVTPRATCGLHCNQEPAIERGMLVTEPTVPEAITGLLRRRGIWLTGRAEARSLLVPCEEAARDRFYGLLCHYSFRLLLRDVLIHRTGFASADLVKYCSQRAVSSYLETLLDAGLVEPLGARDRYRLAPATADSFGDTLEWLVAEILRRELGMEAVHGARLGGVTAGGDFDVLAAAEGVLVYVETKAAPPRHVHRREIAAFFDRVEALRPNVAILVEDTKLRMTDKLLVMFEEELASRFSPAEAQMARLAHETFVLDASLFLTNAAPDLAPALRRCLVHHFRARPYCLPAR